MRLLRVDLERIGVFVGERVSLPDARAIVVYGPNEAGKSTMLAAVRCLLFGFERGDATLAADGDATSLAVGALVELEKNQPGRAEVRRTRGKKAGLVGRKLGSADDFDEEWFSAVLDKPNRLLFENVFGFSLDALRRWDEALKQDEVKTALYGAGFGGTVQPGKVLADIVKEKEAIFVERGSKQPVALSAARLAELRAKRKLVTRTPAELEELSRRASEARARADAHRRSFKETSAELERTRALVNGLEAFGPLEAARAELAALGDVPPLPADAEARHAELTSARARLERELAARAARVAALEETTGRLVVDEELLAASDSIDALYRRLEAYRALVTELPNRRAARADVDERARAELGRLWPAWDLAALAAAPLSDANVAEIEAALAAHAELSRARESADLELTRLDAALRDAEARIAALPEARDVAAVEAWLAAWPAFESDVAALATLAKRVAADERKDRALLGKLSPPWPAGPGAADPLASPAPPVEEVAAHERALARSAQKLEEAIAAFAAKDDEIARIDDDLARLEADGPAPTEEELARAREARDEKWKTVLGALESQAALATSLPLTREYERARLAADATVDVMRRRADAVGRRALLDAQRRRALAAREKLTGAVDAAKAAHATSGAAWAALWSPLGIEPLAPDAMRGWLAQRDALAEHRDRAVEATGERDQVAARVDAHLERGRRCLDLAAGAGPDELRARASAIVAAETARSAEARELAAQRTRDESERRARQTAKARVETDLGQWLDRWTRVTAAVEMPELSVAAAKKLVAPLVALARDWSRDVAAHEARIDRIERDVASFEGDARALPVAAHRDEAPAARVERLQRALEAARAAKSARDARLLELDGAREAHEEARDELASTVEALEAMARAAGAREGDGAALADAVARASRAAVLRRAVAEREEALKTARGTWESKDAYLAALAEARKAPDAVRADLARLEGDSSRAFETQDALLREVVAAEAELARIDTGGAAAEAQSEIEAERARLRELVARYTVLALAEETLSRAIRQFESEHQPELLREASRLFATMTLGRFARVERRLGDGSLVAVLPDERTMAPGLLSTGTREQLYLAIRLAYIEHYCARGAEPLPVVLDDVLVNFDDERAAATLRALAEFAERASQVLLFTCHKRLVATAEAEGIPVAKLAPRSAPRA